MWSFVTAATNTKVSCACELEDLTPVEGKRQMTSRSFQLRVLVLGGLPLKARLWSLAGSQAEGELRMKAKIPESSQFSEMAWHSLCRFSQVKKGYVYMRMCVCVYVCICMSRCMHLLFALVEESVRTFL